MHEKSPLSEQWLFEDAPNVATFTTVRVLEEGYPILLVTHDEDDGAWQFLCAITNEPSDGRIVGLGCIVDNDPSVCELADLPLGWRAWRESIGTPWHREPNVSE